MIEKKHVECRAQTRMNHPKLSVLLISYIFVIMLLSGCEKTKITPDEALIPGDETAPVINTFLPANNSLSVLTNTKISASFSEAMKASTVNNTTFILKEGANSISGTTSYSGTTAIFTPAASLLPNTLYTATVTKEVTDIAGNSLAAAKTWSFTTETGPDVALPTVVTVAPVSGATSVSTSAIVNVTFSESMNPATINASTVTLKKGSTAVAGTVSYTGTTATFTPTGALSANTQYTGTITTAVTDSVGNKLSSDFVWNFTTAALVDATAPTVLSNIPSTNATSVAVNIKATATFSEAMNSATITSSTFTLKQGTTNVAGNVTYSGTTATFTPSAALTGNTVYTASITTGAKDAAGNSMAATYTWSFTTVAAATGKSFATDVMPILGICNDCHTHNWTTSSNASTFYTNLVNSGHVNPTTPTSGRIYTKINGTHGSSSISTTQRNTILTWVTEGSLNN